MSTREPPVPVSSGPPLLTAPNLLTFSRVPLAAAMWIDPRAPWLLVGSMLLAGITDVLDGWVARRLRARLPPDKRLASARRGAWLDPLCDKVFIASAVGVVFVAVGPDLVLVGLLVLRDLLEAPFVLLHRLIPSLRRRLPYDFSAGRAGKLTTVVQFGALVALRLGLALVVPLVVLAAALGIVAFGEYLVRGLRLLKGDGLESGGGPA